MTDEIPFNVTLAIHLNDTNKYGFNACLDGVLNQTLQCEKVCLVDSRISLDDLPLQFLRKANRKLTNAPHYKQCRPSLPLKEVQRVGFDMVTEKFTKQTPLFAWIQANHFMKENFLESLRGSFEKQRYTCVYYPQVLSKSGQKYSPNTSFVVASQIFHEVVNGIQYDGTNLHNIVDIIEPPDPWVKYCYMQDYLEEL